MKLMVTKAVPHTGSPKAFVFLYNWMMIVVDHRTHALWHGVFDNAAIMSCPTFNFGVLQAMVLPVELVVVVAFSSWEVSEGAVLASKKGLSSFHCPSCRKKNKVSRTKPSPAQLSVDTRDDGNGLASVTSNASSTSSRRQQLALPVQKQLAQDIQEAGRINTFLGTEEQSVHQALSVLCNKQQDIYGQQGERIRGQIQKKVYYYWKQYYLDATDADKVLNPLQVKSFTTLQFKSKQQHKEVEPEESSCSDDDSISSNESIPFSVSVQKKKVSISIPSPRNPVSISILSPTRNPVSISSPRTPIAMEFQKSTPTPEGAGK
jgi:hypothetical protein